jgi:hypothetical protein
METSMPQDARIRIRELEAKTEGHMKNAVRPVVYTFLSTMPLLFSLVAHSAWEYISPETHTSGEAILNHVLASGVCLGYNGIRLANGEFRGLIGRFKEYWKDEGELVALKERYGMTNTKGNIYKLNNSNLNK